MGYPPPPTRYGATAPAAQMAGRPAVSIRPPAAPGPVIQGFFAGGGPARAIGPQRTSSAYPVPSGFRLPAAPGQKLPDAFRRGMEQAFKTDFSAVRVHLGTEAGAIGALAFTAGDRIVMAPGQYAPDTLRGQQLLAHELAHVVQQRAGRVRNPLGAGLAIVHDPQLETEADRLGAQAVLRQGAAAPPRSPAMPRPSRPAGAPTVQAYFVMGYYSLWRQAPAWYEPCWYPHAVVGNTTLPAQEKRGGRGTGEDQYLRAGDGTRAHVTPVAVTGASLRVSDDYEMAIEDSDLKLRQPKTFFATNAVLNASARALQGAGSPITLHRTGQQITIVGWTCRRTLYEVSPQFNGGNPNQLPQNCNEMARRVGNLDIDEASAPMVPIDAMRNVLGKRAGAAVTSRDLMAYSRIAGTRAMRGTGVNAYAAPNVGEAFMIGSVTNSLEIYDQLMERMRGLDTEEERAPFMRQLQALDQRDRWRDYGDNVDRRLKWPYHFAGVVAQSGNDRITLENYARGDDRRGAPDPRWFFQMYGGKSGQTFHEANKGDDYVNPITTRYTAR